MLALLPGCQPVATNRPPPSNDPARITLLLPEFKEFPDRDPPRLLTITVGGEPVPHSVERKQTVETRLKPGQDSVTIVVSFWPASYSNTIRTRVVPVKPGLSTTVDVTSEDPAQPDRFEAIFFETPADLLEAMMKLAEVGPKDTVLDIGCGDGRLVIEAVKQYRAAKGIGVDIRSELIDLCQANAKKAGVVDRTTFRVEDALKMKSVAEASVVFLYLGEDLSGKLRPLLQNTLKPGARVVSLDFPIGDWKPDEVKTVTTKNNYGKPQEFILSLWRIR